METIVGKLNRFLVPETDIDYLKEIEEGWRKDQHTYSLKELTKIFPEAKRVIREKIIETYEQLLEAKTRIFDSYRHSLREPTAKALCEATSELIYEQEIQPLQKTLKRLSWQHQILTSPRKSKKPIDLIALKEANDLKVMAENSGLKLQRCGDHWLCRCPFHAGGNERNPSCHIWTDHFHCFSCSKHGDLFDFVELFQGIDFKQALRSLTNYE